MLLIIECDAFAPTRGACDIKRGKFSNECHQVSAGLRLQIEYADISLVGGRTDNQDRAGTAANEAAALLVVSDGMGGHSNGALAAETSVRVMINAFGRQAHPLQDPLGFLHLTLGRAHEKIVELGGNLPLEQRPRATCAAAVVQGDSAYWAHVGDSRVYHLRGGRVLERTRDHSHVEFLIREGVIDSEEAQSHPMRNYVECCLGGELMLPEMSITTRRVLKPNDVLLLCSDGLWGSLPEAEIARTFSDPSESLKAVLQSLAVRAVKANGENGDNTTASALRFLSA
jgi:serine/threonine protein phosphatase PrpC